MAVLGSPTATKWHQLVWLQLPPPSKLTPDKGPLVNQWPQFFTVLSFIA